MVTHPTIGEIMSGIVWLEEQLAIWDMRTRIVYARFSVLIQTKARRGLDPPRLWCRRPFNYPRIARPMFLGLPCIGTSQTPEILGLVGLVPLGRVAGSASDGSELL